jgi:hypothetical protein
MNMKKNMRLVRATAAGTALLLAAAGCGRGNNGAAELSGVKAVKSYLAGHSGGTAAAMPVPLTLSGIVLSAPDTARLFAALDAAGKYVALDLSGCTGLTAWEQHRVGAAKIVSLAVPDSVTDIADNAFARFASLKTFAAAGAHTVGASAFSDCRALETATLPAAIGVGNNAFSGCTALVSASLPTAIGVGNNAFSGCAALVSANLPAATTVGKSAFNHCTALVSANLPAAIGIGNNAFSGCTALETANLPAAIGIGNNAFSNCTVLVSASLPAAIGVGNNAFSGCTALISANLPAATAIEKGIFNGCTRLTDIRISSDNPDYSAKGGMLLNKAGTALVAYPGATGAITLPVTGIGAGTFSGCVALISANLPVATAIGAGAFSGCTALETANLPAATAIGEYAFYNCSALASLTLGATLPAIGTSVFYGAGKDASAGFTVYVPNEATKSALEDAIAAAANTNWHRALKGDIGAGKFNAVAITR